MTSYRFCFLDDKGSPCASEVCECADDLKALEKAYALCAEFDVEVWRGSRRICRVKRTAKPVTPQAPASR